MIKDQKQSKLTSLAEETVEELVEAYKTSLIEKASNIANSRNADADISVVDIIQAYDKKLLEAKVDSIYKEKKIINKRKRRSTLITIIGAAYALVGIVIYYIQNVHFSIKNDLGLLVTTVGIFIVLITFFFNELIALRPVTLFNERKYIEIDSYEIVKKWQTIERLTISFLRAQDLINKALNPIGQVVEYLQRSIALSDVDRLSIRELLKVRNLILHQGYEPNDDEKLKYITTANEIIEKLERLQA